LADGKGRVGALAQIIEVQIKNEGAMEVRTVPSKHALRKVDTQHAEHAHHAQHAPAHPQYC